MNQVRAAIFSSLAERVVGARVLDLFAGAGGLGIEALSRGASAVTFVEQDRAAVDCIRRNLEKTKLTAGARVVSQDCFAFLNRRGGADNVEPFDLIFADPPYTTREQPVDFAARLTSSEVLKNALLAGGLFILEKSPRHPLTLEAQAWEVIRQKQYGSTEVLFLQRPAGADVVPATGSGSFAL